jgi:hypothetical protein
LWIWTIWVRYINKHLISEDSSFRIFWNIPASFIDGFVAAFLSLFAGSLFIHDNNDVADSFVNQLIDSSSDPFFFVACSDSEPSDEMVSHTIPDKRKHSHNSGRRGLSYLYPLENCKNPEIKESKIKRLIMTFHKQLLVVSHLVGGLCEKEIKNRIILHTNKLLHERG